MAKAIQVVKKGMLATGPATEGMARKETPVAEGACILDVLTEPGAVSGWHHHGSHTTYGFVLSGRLRFEFGPGGHEVAEAGPGDFFVVPPNTVHREGNPGAERQSLAGVRVGSGPTVVNVEGPDEG